MMASISATGREARRRGVGGAVKSAAARQDPDAVQAKPGDLAENESDRNSPGQPILVDG